MNRRSILLPVSWPAFAGILLPQWTKVLQGLLPCDDFCRHFDVGRATRSRCDAIDWNDVPADYLALIDWTGETPVTMAKRLHESARHAEITERGYASVGSRLVVEAIVHGAAGALPPSEKKDDGDEEDQGQSLEELRRDHGSIPELPEQELVLFNERPKLIDALFSTRLVNAPPSYWRCQSRGLVTQETMELIGALFLATLAVPGTEVLPEPWSWPAGDGLFVQGALDPADTARLANNLAEIGDIPDRDEEAMLLPLIDDIASRAARGGNIGLIVLYGTW